MIEEYKYPLCSGENCARKNICMRFKRDINRSKEDHFAWPPLKEDGRCLEFVEKPIDPLVETLKKLLNGDKDN